MNAIFQRSTILYFLLSRINRPLILQTFPVDLPNVAPLTVKFI